MKYEIGYQTLTFETMLKTIVKKTIKKNYNNYSDDIKNEIDLENIFSSIFQGFELTNESFQKHLGSVINPVSKDGEFIKIIEPSSYFRLFTEYMVKNTFSETNDNTSVSFKKHYEDILIAIGHQSAFMNKYPCVKDFFKIKLNVDNRTLNLMNTLVNGNYEQGQKIYKEGKFFEKEWAANKETIDMLINQMDILVSSLFSEKIEQSLSFNYFLINEDNEYKVCTSSGMKKISQKEVFFYKEVFLSEIENTLKRTVAYLPEGLRDKFVNKVNVLSHKEVNKKIKGYNNRLVKETPINYIEEMQSMFNKYRSKNLECKITPMVFEKTPSLNAIKFNRDVMDISCLNGATAAESLVQNIIECINMMTNERILFKSMRVKSNKEDVQILFNFKEEIPRIEKENLLNALEDMILSVLKERNNGGEWFIVNNKEPHYSHYSLSINEISQKFLDLNSEAFLRVKLSSVEKEEPVVRVKKKL